MAILTSRGAGAQSDLRIVLEKELYNLLAFISYVVLCSLRPVDDEVLCGKRKGINFISTCTWTQVSLGNGCHNVA